jgi:hypothetical protein
MRSAVLLPLYLASLPSLSSRWRAYLVLEAGDGKLPTNGTTFQKADKLKRIFIIEGILTCTIAIVGYIVIVRFPDQERDKPSFKFLNPEECEYIINKLDKDRGDVETEPFSLKKYLKPALDIEIWGFAFIFL